jgi:hypothetical protein
LGAWAATPSGHQRLRDCFWRLCLHGRQSPGESTYINVVPTVPISIIWYSDNNARKRLRGGKIGGGCACVLAWRVKARLPTVARGLTRNDCHLVAPLAVAPIRHVGNEPCFVFFLEGKHRAEARHVSLSPFNALHRWRCSMHKPGLHLTDCQRIPSYFLHFS